MYMDLTNVFKVIKLDISDYNILVLNDVMRMFIIQLVVQILFVLRHDDVELFSNVFLENTLFWLVISFFLFRLFDIWKPLGIKFFDRKHGAFNVMIDDAIAGFYSAFLVIFLSTFFQ